MTLHRKKRTYENSVLTIFLFYAALVIFPGLIQIMWPLLQLPPLTFIRWLHLLIQTKLYTVWLIAKNVSLMAIRNYTTRYQRQRNMCVWCLFMFLFRSLPSIVGGLRGPTMYRARNLYLVHTVDSFSLLLVRRYCRGCYCISIASRLALLDLPRQCN